MCWRRVIQTMSFREEIIRLGEQAGVNIRQLCRRFGISAKTYYKWRNRYRKDGGKGLENQSRRPGRSPTRSPARVETAILKVRTAHPQWGARKIETVLRQEGMKTPARSTIQDVLKRNGCIDEKESAKHRPWQRFERDGPNQLWQMDFKGWSRMQSGCECQPLSIVDDHSRYAVCLQACSNQQTGTVKEKLTEVFRSYGMPEWIMVDNGSPWGYDEQRRWTPLTAWLIRLNVGVRHSRPYHPQTQGKVERFHRTLQQEVLEGRQFGDLKRVQEAFDQWRTIYNQHRPHEALQMQVPASRYRISPREFPEKLSPIEYESMDQIRHVDVRGYIRYRGQKIRIGKGFRGNPVGLRQTDQDGLMDVYFCTQKVAQIDLRTLTTVTGKEL